MSYSLVHAFSWILNKPFPAPIVRACACVSICPSVSVCLHVHICEYWLRNLPTSKIYKASNFCPVWWELMAWFPLVCTVTICLKALVHTTMKLASLLQNRRLQSFILCTSASCSVLGGIPFSSGTYSSGTLILHMKDKFGKGLLFF